MSGEPAFSIPIKNVFGTTRAPKGAPPTDFIVTDEDGLLRFYHVDQFYRYPHVITGYRPSLTTLECIKSLITLHNQTFNTLVMVLLLPMAIVYAMFGLYAFETPVATHLAILLVIQWWCEAPFSIAYKTLQAVSLDVAKCLCRLDYASIYLCCPIALY